MKGDNEIDLKKLKELKKGIVIRHIPKFFELNTFIEDDSYETKTISMNDILNGEIGKRWVSSDFISSGLYQYLHLIYRDYYLVILEFIDAMKDRDNIIYNTDEIIFILNVYVDLMYILPIVKEYI
ncbi:MAG: hypothetical protein QXO65_03410 [Candidatus Aenigmatarchaeota archaeon]